MANTKIQNLPTASLAEIANTNNFFLYMADLSNSKDVKFQARDFFTTVNSSGTGLSLIHRMSINNVSLKTIKALGDAIKIIDAGSGIEVSLLEASIDLENCNNENASFIKTVDLGANVGDSTLSIINGGTGANDQASALDLITNSSGGTVNQVIKTDGTSASWAGINSLITAGEGLKWNTATAPYTLDVNLDDVTFTSNITFNNTVTISSHNLGMGAGWISNDGSSEGINIDNSGKVFIGTGTSIFNEALTVTGNLSFNAGGTRAISMGAPSTGAGDEFQILGSAPSASNQAGGDITIKGGVGSGSGAGGAVSLYAGNSTSGDGDINMYVTDAGTQTQALKIHGSNKHFTVGSTGVNNGAKFDIQNDTALAACLELHQNDTDEPFITFTGTTATDQTKSLSTDTSVGAITGHIRVNVNGTDYWLAYYVPN